MRYSPTKTRCLRMFVLVVSVVVIAGCSSAGPMLSVLQGNLAYGRGDYQTALVHYLATEEDAADRGWVLFNTGNVYYALGEQEAALSAWSQARQGAGAPDDPSTGSSRATVLIHAASYNRGVLLFQRGDYQTAYEEFRYALSVDATSLSAKANLELALQKLRAAEQAQQAGQAGAGGTTEAEEGEPGPATLRILEYVRRKETQRWFANRESQDAGDPRDW